VLNFVQISSTNNSYAAVTSGTFQNRILTLTVGYEVTLQFLPLLIFITPSLSNLSALLPLPSSSTTVFMNPTNMPAYNYTDSVYLQARISQIAVLAISILAIFVFAIGSLKH
jgi:hypothetical protein